MATISSKSHVFQQTELHDEYFKLVDVVSELKSACQLEQERRVKAIARVRRLEEIVVLKDRKIESLLQARAGRGGLDLSLGGASAAIAQRDCQHNALVQKLRIKISQQSQILGEYEEALQTLRSRTKSTSLMELEEERSQLYQEVHRLQALLSRQQYEIASHGEQVNLFADAETSYKGHVARLQQETKRILHEKHKLEQELAFHRSRVDALQQQLALEQRKRTYDQQVSWNGHVQATNMASPSRAAILSRVLEDMKASVPKEDFPSIQRDKCKSPRAGTISTPKAKRAVASALQFSPLVDEGTLSTLKTPIRAGASNSLNRAQSRPTNARPARPQVDKTSILPAASISPRLSESYCVANSTSDDEPGRREVKAASSIEEPESGEVARVHPASNGNASANCKRTEIVAATCPEIGTECDGAAGAASVASALAKEHDVNDPIVPSMSISAVEKVKPNASNLGNLVSPFVAIRGSEEVHAGAQVDTEDMHRQKLAEVERMLREVDDDLDHDLESNSSEEFLEVAHLHTPDQHDATQNNDAINDGQTRRSPSVAYLSSSPSSSPSSSSRSSRSVSEAQDPSFPTSLVPNGPSDMEQANRKVVGPSPVIPTTSAEPAHSVNREHVGYEDGYHSDFTEASSP